MTSEALLLQAADRLSAGDPEAAEPLLRRILEEPLQSPRTTLQAARQLALICVRSGRMNEAIELLQGALLLSPEEGSLWGDLAAAQLAAGDPEASLECWQRCESLGCATAEQRHDHGVALLLAGRAEAARHRFEELLLEQPEQPRIRSSLAQALEAVACRHYEAERWDVALQSLKRALALFEDAADATPAGPADPEHPDAELLAVLHDNAGILLQNQGRLTEAIAAHERALAFAPGRAESHLHLALALLQAGEMQRGWHAYTWRFRTEAPAPLCAAVAPPSPQDPCPRDGPLRLIGEQGLGDMLQFLRYLQQAVVLNAEVRLCLPEKLHGLARSSAIRCALLPPGEAEAEGPWLPLMSLPLHLESAGVTRTAAGPYLRVPEKRRRHWQRHLRDGLAAGETLLGVHWQGNPDVERIQHRGRSFPLERLAPIARLPGVRLLSLQRGFGAEQRRDCSFREAFVDDQDDLEGILDFIEVGAMACACDLILSSDSALAHLAGGLGLPTWLLLRHVPDWRWGLAGEQTPWYPCMRLFRQSRPGDWDGVIADVELALRSLSSAPRDSAPQSPHFSR